MHVHLRHPAPRSRVAGLAGQYLDMLTQASGDETPEAALQIDRYRTAAYTVERPLHLGAVLGATTPGLVDAYRRSAPTFGIAFQLRDDLLSLFGDPEVTGKPAGDDLREGKADAAADLRCWSIWGQSPRSSSGSPN